MASRNFWTNVATVGADITKFTMQNLIEETEFDFRVAAVNAEGQSPYLETVDVTKPVRKISKLI